MYNRLIKRLLDIVLSSIGIMVLTIPMLIVAMIVKLDSPGPVLFKQRRIGKHKREFILLKFRSMPISAPHDVATHQLPVESVNMSRFQRTIRKFSIDELPQLFNIWIGQMSIIGPRPALWNQYDLIAEREKYGANDVKPGLTGWAQINGRDELEIPIKAKLDGEYVERMGFLFDCKCFFKTIISVLRHDGVLEGGRGVLEKGGTAEKMLSERGRLNE